MTTEQFLTAHSIIGKQTQININYSKEGETTAGIISGVTITTTTKKDWNESLASDNTLDLTTALQQVKNVKFIIGNTTYNLAITDRAKYTDTTANRNLDYFYFAVNPIDINLSNAVEIMPGESHTATANNIGYNEATNTTRLIVNNPGILESNYAIEWN